MISVLDKIFDNPFDDPKITPARFLDFCMFVYDAMNADNEEGKYDKELPIVKSIIDSIDKEINEVDTGVHAQVNNTSETNAFIKGFGQFMKINDGTIAYALGGNTTAAFLEFYPYKNEEYLTANRVTMPKLVARVSTLAKKYADQLGGKLTEDLQAFSPGYKKILTAQRTQISSVNQNRVERNVALLNAQWLLTGVVYSVAGINLRNPVASEKLFPFDKLYPQSRERILKLKGELAAGETKEILNRMLTADIKVRIANKSANANMMIWLALTPEEAAPENAVVINANKKITVTADKLGNLNGTFLMVKNLSDVNKTAYAIGVIGLKKEDGTEEGEIKGIKLKIA